MHPGETLVNQWLLDNSVRLKATCASLAKCCSFDPAMARVLLRSTAGTEKCQISVAQSEMDKSQADSATMSGTKDGSVVRFPRIPTGLSMLDDRGYKEVAKVACMLGSFSVSNSTEGRNYVLACLPSLLIALDEEFVERLGCSYTFGISVFSALQRTVSAFTESIQQSPARASSHGALQIASALTVLGQIVFGASTWQLSAGESIPENKGNILVPGHMHTIHQSLLCGICLGNDLAFSCFLSVFHLFSEGEFSPLI